MHDQAITMAVGGIETTGATLSWCRYHLGALLGLATIGRRWRLLPVPGQKVKEITTAAAPPNKVPMRIEARQAARVAAA